MVLSDHYLKKYSHKPFQTWCEHLLGGCSEQICFLTTLAKFWPSSGHKMTENYGFRPLPEKVSTKFISTLVCTLIGWVFRIGLICGHLGQNLTLWWPQNDGQWWFPTIIWKSIHAIQFKLRVHLLGECSEMICFLAMLAKFWPSSGHTLTENYGFGPVSLKVPLCGTMVTQSISNTVFTLVRGVFTNRPHRPN